VEEEERGRRRNGGLDGNVAVVFFMYLIPSTDEKQNHWSVTVLPYTIGYRNGTHISGLEAVRSCPTPTHSAAKSVEDKCKNKEGRKCL
jgi:hypothetical protein